MTHGELAGADDGWVKEYVNAPGKHADQWAAEFEQIYVRCLF
jgi:hypothetical protein